MSLFRNLKVDSLSSLHFQNDEGFDNAETLGGGTNATPILASGSKNFIDFRFKNIATTGDIRGLYLRHYLSGGAGGEAARLFTTIGAASGTAHGAHISLSFGASPATLSGLGVAVRGTLHVPDRAITLGTVAAVQAEVYMDGTSSDPTATKLSLFRGIVDGGDATAQNKVLHVFEFVNLGSTIFPAHSAFVANLSKALKINVNGTDYYIGLSTSA